MLHEIERSPASAPSLGAVSGRILLDVRQVAAALNCGRTLVYQLIADRELPTVKVGRLTRVPVSELEAFVARRLGQGRVPHG